MSDIKLFSFKGPEICELEGSSVQIERSLQNQIETHLNALLGVRFLASEYSTGKRHKGRIDTLGIDENGCPVIIEYKRAVNENVINQGLFYLDWLMDHKAEFKLLVMESLGQDIADGIEWSAPRLLCIAGNFTKYDDHAVQQINRNIELLRYKKYGEDLLLLELTNAVEASSIDPEREVKYTTAAELLEKSPEPLNDLFDSLKAYLMALGDDVQMKELKYYFAFKRIRNFACVEVHPQARKLIVFVKVNPDSIDPMPDYARDVSKIGHYGTGDLELTLKTAKDLDRAKPIIVKSYESS